MSSRAEVLCGLWEERRRRTGAGEAEEDWRAVDGTAGVDDSVAAGAGVVSLEMEIPAERIRAGEGGRAG